MEKNMWHGGKWTWQGPLGPHCHAGRWPCGAARHHPVPIHIINPWDASYTAYNKHPFLVGLSSGHDSLAMDPWAHCHPLGGHQPTLEPTLDQVFTCARNATAFGSKLWPSNAMVVHQRAGWRPHPTTRRPRKLHCLSTSYKYPPCSLML